MRKDKQQAIKLRKSGLSYNEISKKLKVGKSTLSYWFKNIPELEKIKEKNTNNAKKVWAANITKYNKERAKKARNQWVITQNKAQKEIKRINQRELKLIGIALYWAEGYKKGNWNVIFCNSDPHMNMLIMRFFTEICQVPIDKIRAQVQLHNNINSEKAISYWSKIIKLQKKQFLKSTLQKNRYSKSRRGNTLPYGTLRIRINDVVLVNKIKGWINSLKPGCSSVG